MQISCAMTTYNSNPIFLQKQLDSLRLQERPFDEVILVDDASTNETVKWIKDYIKKYHLWHWKVITQKKNAGFVRSFIKALEATTKDIVFLCDHDDIWHQDKTKRMSEILQSDPELLALASSFDLIDQNDAPLSMPCDPQKANHNLIPHPVNKGGLTYMNFHEIRLHNFAPGCTLAVKRELIQDYLKHADDIDLPHDWALCALATLRKPQRLADQKALAYLDEALIDYRQHPNNTLGLSRRKTYYSRLEGAYQDFLEKQSLMYLTQVLFFPPCEQVEMGRIFEVYQTRYEAMRDLNYLSLFWLLFTSQIPGLWKTLGMDLKVVVPEALKPRKPVQRQTKGQIFRNLQKKESQ